MTHETLNKLPPEVRKSIETIRQSTKQYPRYRELYVNKGLGYCQALKDSGILTEPERRILSCYITV